MYRSGTVSLAAVLGRLPEQLGLEGEDVIEHAVDAATFEAMVGDDPGALEMAPKRASERPVDPGLPPHLRIFEHLQATIESDLP